MGEVFLIRELLKISRKSWKSQGILGQSGKIILESIDSLTCNNKFDCAPGWGGEQSTVQRSHKLS